MKLYLISQTERDGYDTYSDAVVAAINKEEAKKICPNKYYGWDEKTDAFIWGAQNEFKKKHSPKGQRDPNTKCGSWASHFKNVKVTYLGEAKEGTKSGVICASFHAG